MQLLIVVSLAAAAAAAHVQGIGRPEVAAVRAVVDGNTLDVAGYGRLRLAGIQAPRPSRRGLDADPLALRAKERLEGIVTHRFVRLEFPPASRSSAYVLLEDGTFVNAVLVREGLARATRSASGERGAALRRAEAEARLARRGLWERPR